MEMVSILDVIERATDKTMTKAISDMVSAAAAAASGESSADADADEEEE